MSKVGELLKSKRESKNLTLNDVYKSTAIRESFLRQIEAGQFYEMPSYAHAYGFLEQYSKLLGLNFIKDVKPLFDEECQKYSFGNTTSSGPVDNVSKAVNKPKNKTSLAVVIVSAVVALALVFTIITMTSGEKQAVVDTPQQPQEPAVVAVDNISELSSDNQTADNGTTALKPQGAVDNTTRPVTTTPQTAAPAVTPAATNSATASVTPPAARPAPAPVPVAPTPTPAATPVATPVVPKPLPKHSAKMVFNDICWVNLVVDNTTESDFIAEPGTERVVPFDSDFLLDIGNASAVTIIYDNQTITNIGGYRKPIKNLEFKINEEGALFFEKKLP